MAFRSSSSTESRLFLLLLIALSLCVAFVRTETVAEASPTLQSDNQDFLSGAGGIDVSTKDPLQDSTQNIFTDVLTDHTDMPTVEDEGVLGPGAITAIVIAVFLGASVLLALIVITLRKFTAS